MSFIDWQNLSTQSEGIRKNFKQASPFGFVVIEDFLLADKALEVHDEFPPVEKGEWDGTTYLHQKKKFQQNKFEKGSLLSGVFKELNSSKTTSWLNEVTGIEEPLQADPQLFGGGLHQSVTGAFLDVHVDYNKHPATGLHRRLNLLIYLNKDWHEKYEGDLELWDIRADRKKLIAKIPPLFNRCVIFETNEISFHGHPKPLKTPPGLTRKSLATYYYSAQRPTDEIAPEHNTIFVNTEGVTGMAKAFKAGIKAFFERLRG